MKKVLVFGTFDIFHKGHEDFLRQAREQGLPADAERGQGGWLRVVVARDATVAEVKKQETVNDENARVEAIRKSGLTDEVVLGNLEDKFLVVKEFAPDVICLGYDQKFFIDELENKLKEFGLEKTRIVRLNPYMPEKYKSSLLRGAPQ